MFFIVLNIHFEEYIPDKELMICSRIKLFFDRLLFMTSSHNQKIIRSKNIFEKLANRDVFINEQSKKSIIK